MTATARLIAWLTFVGAYIVLAYASRAVGGAPSNETLYRYDTAVGGVVWYAISLAVVLLITRGSSQRDLLALRRPESIGRAFGLSLAVIVGIYAATAAAEPLLHAGKEQGLTPPGWESEHAGAYAANFVVVALIAPVVEELMFRGAGYSLLVRFGEVAAIVLVGLLFGLVHGLIAGLVVLSLFGAALAWLRAKTASVYPGMAVHAVFNSIALIVAVTT
jgi:membrane protease YdiL (CAAX protease family)